MDLYSLRPLPDNQKQEIERCFLGNSPEAIQPNHDIKTYVICFTNRCGSNYFASGLSSDPALGLATELYHAKSVIDCANRFGIQGIEEYTARRMQRFVTPAGIFGVKLGAIQLLYLAEKGIIRKFWHPPVFIHVRRNNTIAQAVSYMFALQTEKWTSLDDGNGKQPEYDPALILRFLKAIHQSNSIFDYFFDIHEVKPINVVYENLDMEFPRAADELARLLGRKHSTATLNTANIQSQATELNKEFEERFRDDLRNISVGQTA